ncbi:MAG: GNAT family N-acetyltransferase [Anaerococcus sp.]|nr:GNAT family N-acetyltransferase [Peptoniphilaceae bacterium]MDY3054858.1 GNAT family N-acetyltransferase [Anaerococcus sp.]
MEIIKVSLNDSNEEFLSYLKTVDWGAAKNLRKYLENKTVKENLGKDSQIFYAKEDGNIIGFFALVNQDYIKLPTYDRFISSVWVDPSYRGRGLSYDFVKYAEKESGLKKMNILSQHKGLYEKMGYKLIDNFTDSIHDKDYLYEKTL